MTLARRWVQSPNHTVCHPRTVRTIVLHYTAGMNIDSAVGWFSIPYSRVSAHYIIGREGQVVQMVHEEDVAWHAGVWKVNVGSIGIELVGTDGPGFTEPQLSALWLLLTELVQRYHVEPDQVVGHKDILPGQKIDPDGTHQQFPWGVCRTICAAALAEELARAGQKAGGEMSRVTKP